MENFEFNKLLPGFRTMTPWKMIVSILVYLSLILSMFLGPGTFIIALSCIVAIFLNGQIGFFIKTQKVILKSSIHIAIIWPF